MALAKRAEGEFKTAYDDTFRVQIWEEGYVGSAIELTFATPGFTLEYMPDSNDISSPIIPSYCEVFIINDSASVDTLITDLIAKQQADFYITINRDTGGGYTKYWKGVVLQDEIKELDKSKPREIVIGASDGLNLLQAVDYDFANTVSATTNNPAHTPVISIIDKCLEQALDQTLWGGSDDYLVTSVDWWETDQIYSSTADPLKDLVIDVLGFKEAKTTRASLFNGLYGPEILDDDYLTCWEVLEQLALIFLCRIYQFNGAWHFEQIPLRSTSTTKRMKYTTSLGTPTYTKPNTYTTLDGSRKKARLAMNQSTYFPALKKVTVEQGAYGSDFTNEMVLDGSNLANTSVRDFGLYSDEYFTSAAGTQVSQALFIRVEFKNSFGFAYDNTQWVSLGSLYQLMVMCTVDVEIKLSDAYSADVWYWDDSANQWTTSSTTNTINSYNNFKIASSPSSGSISFNSAVGGSIIFNTTYLPATGILEITIDNLKPKYLSALPNTYTDIPSGDLTLGPGNIVLTVKTLLERGDTAFLYAVENPNTDINDNEIYDYPKLLISDKTVQSGHLMLNNGTSIEACDEWEVATNGNNLPLPALLVQQRLAIQSEPVETYEGQILFTEGYGEGVGFDSKFWLAHDYQFIAHTGEVSATWYKIGIYNSLGNPSENPSELRTLSGNASKTYGVAPNTFQDVYRRVTGVNYDSVNDVQIITAKTQLTTEIYKATTVIDASASGNSTLGTDVYWIKLSWSGGNGTYVLNMNALIEGQEYKIYADSTITATTIVALTPDTENINGSTEYNIDGVGIYHVVAIDGEWVIYQ